MIETHGLRKAFGSTVAVSDLSLQVREGEIFGFLGPNGAGKTTSIKMLGQPRRAELWDGPCTRRAAGRSRGAREIGFLPEHFRFHETLTATELLRFHGRLTGCTACRWTPDRSAADSRDLADAADRPLGGYSKGMQQRWGWLRRC